jgi:thiol-disulfide isomerase/thioredoxin
MVTEATDKDFKNIIDSNVKVIVKYFADWCGTCKLFAPKFKRLSNDEIYAGIIFLEVNAENNPDARKMGGVTNLPFIVTFENGKVIQQVATGKEEAVVEILQKMK